MFILITFHELLIIYSISVGFFWPLLCSRSWQHYILVEAGQDSVIISGLYMGVRNFMLCTRNLLNNSNYLQNVLISSCSRADTSNSCFDLACKTRKQKNMATYITAAPDLKQEVLYATMNARNACTLVKWTQIFNEFIHTEPIILFWYKQQNRTDYPPLARPIRSLELSLVLNPTNSIAWSRDMCLCVGCFSPPTPRHQCRRPLQTTFTAGFSLVFPGSRFCPFIHTLFVWNSLMQPSSVQNWCNGTLYFCVK